MTQAMFRWLGAGLMLGLLAFPVRADDKPKADAGKPSQPYVVLVGISNYADNQIKPRPHAEDDAKALFELLTDKKYLVGADAEHSRLLLGKDATHDNILKALRWIADNAKSNDPVIFGFFGEGGPVGETGTHRCYFAADSTFAGRDKNAIAATEIGDALKNLKSQHFCALIDVDFKGFTTNDKKIADATLGINPYKEFLGTDDNEEELSKPGRELFLATIGLNRSLDLKDHGVFAQVLLDGLRGAADKDGYEADGVITVDELTKYLVQGVRELVRDNGQTKKEKEQHALVIDSRGVHTVDSLNSNLVRGRLDYVLTANPNVAAKIKEQKDKFVQLVKDGKVPDKYAEEGKTYLERMPRLEAQRKLRQEYQALIEGKIDVEKFAAQRKAILDGTKLPREQADEFSGKIMKAIALVTRDYVKELDPHKLVEWAIRGLYKQVDEKISAKIEARLKDVADMKADELAELLADARQELGQREDLDKHKDIDYTLWGMLHKHTDNYTTYIDREEKERLKKEIGGRFPGVGIQIRKDSVTDQLLVVTPIMGSPAYKKGIEAGDLITTVIREVDSQGKPLNPPEKIPTRGMTLSEAVEKITGRPGTNVKLTVQREGEDKPREFELTRAVVDVASVLGFKRKADDTWDYMIDPKNKIGYIRLTSFMRNSYQEMEVVMKQLMKSDLKGLILDLRFNPGGLLDSAIDISDLFVDDGTIVSIKTRGRREQFFTGTSRGSLTEFKMVCLVNGGSASGSEIVAACLQDHDRAKIYGERSYGKGSVQHIHEFDYGGEIKLTVATFWRPSKKNLNKSTTSGKEDEDWGVRPDKLIKLTPKEHVDLREHLHDIEIIRPKGKPVEAKKFEDKQLEEALKFLQGHLRTASNDGR
jgi:carboxyl-terminal processing protease